MKNIEKLFFIALLPFPVLISVILLIEIFNGIGFTALLKLFVRYWQIPLIVGLGYVFFSALLYTAIHFAKTQEGQLLVIYITYLYSFLLCPMAFFI